MFKETNEINAIVISVDLKDSEALFKLGASKGLGGSLIQKLMFHLSKVINHQNAELISNEGDSILFFIPINSNFIEVIISALNTCLDFKKSLNEFIVFSKLPKEFELRMAIDLGKIRPIWHELDGRKFPGWEQLGNSNVFVNLARMLEAESIIKTRQESIIVIRPELFEMISNEFPRVDFHKTVSLIKHNRSLDLYIGKVN
jgi:hypothetical protein